MGRVYRRGGRIYIDYVDANGARVRRRFGRTRREAERELSAREAAVFRGEYNPDLHSGGKTFGEVAEIFWERHGRFLASKSWREFLNAQLLKFAGFKMRRLGVAELQEYYNEVRDRASAATANRHLTLLRLVFNKAIAWEISHGKNPCAGVKMGREENRRLRFLSQEEIVALLGAADPRIKPLLACALMTGMRKGEMLGLNWESVDLERRSICLARTKSGRLRNVPIPDRLVEILEPMRREDGPVFQVKPMTLRRLFEKAKGEARIAGFRFHDLRHTFASWYAMATGDLAALREILGHSTIHMTMRYAHLTDRRHRENLRAFDREVGANIQAALPSLVDVAGTPESVYHSGRESIRQMGDKANG